MPIVTLTSAECLKWAKRIVKSLARIQAGDALRILYTAVNFITMRTDGAVSPSSIGTVNINLRPRRRGFSPILEKDQEMRAYIHGLTEFLTVKELRQELVNKFGAGRVPGEETLRRYLKRCSQSATE